MKSMKSIFSICIVLFCSCDQIQLQIADSDVPVVESYLNPGEEILIKIVRQLVYSSADSVNENLDNLNVIIEVSDSVFLLNNTGNGIYENPEIKIQPLKEYVLSFEYNNKLVKANTIVPGKPTGFKASDSTIVVYETELNLIWQNTDKEYHMIVIENIEADLTPINATTSDIERIFRTIPTMGTSLSLNTRNFIYYGKHQIVLFKINPEYAELYEQLGTSSLDIQAPPSNVENGLGIFTGINSDTLFVNVVLQ